MSRVLWVGLCPYFDCPFGGLSGVFNATRYIRLTYTTLAILLEIIATILIAVAVASAVKK
jgi:hypothetical protein